MSIIGGIISDQGKNNNGGKLILTGEYVVLYLEGSEINGVNNKILLLESESSRQEKARNIELRSNSDKIDLLINIRDSTFDIISSRKCDAVCESGGYF